MKNPCVFIILVFLPSQFLLAQQASGNLPGRSASEHARQLVNEVLQRNSHSSVQNIDILDSSVRWRWDSLQYVWNFNYKNTFGYDVAYNNIYQLMQGRAGNSWMNTADVTITYNSSGLAITSMSRQWNGASWQNRGYYTNGYDANGNMISEVMQLWNGSSWDNSEMYTMTYDANNNLLSQLLQSWSGSSWDNYLYFTWTYDANNNQTSALRQTWNGSAWVNDNLNSNTFDVNNNLLQQLDQVWSNNNWVDGARLSFTYNVNNYVTDDVLEIYSNNNWDTSWADHYSYDANFNMIDRVWMYYYAGNWTNSQHDIRTYFPNNLLESWVNQTWNQNAWENVDSTRYYYSNVSSVALQAAENADLKISPNPSNGYYRVVGLFSGDEMVITDISGRILLSRNIEMPGELDIREFPDGIYFLNLYRQGERSVFRLIKAD